MNNVEERDLVGVFSLHIFFSGEKTPHIPRTNRSFRFFYSDNFSLHRKTSPVKPYFYIYLFLVFGAFFSDFQITIFLDEIFFDLITRSFVDLK